MKHSDGSYPRYRCTLETAWELILRFGICSLPVSPSKILQALEVDIHSYANSADILKELDIGAEHNDGFLLLKDGKWRMFYNDQIKPAERIRFTAAHEIGHIMLKHNLQSADTVFGRVSYTCRNNGKMDIRDPLEFEANIFASRLLAPAIVLHDLGVDRAEDIARLCGLSLQAARYRAERMKVLERRSKFGTHPLERKVRESFRDFVKKQVH